MHFISNHDELIIVYDWDQTYYAVRNVLVFM